ncbi:DUF5343 domain-containing protein [uncultured Maricaulis sp.]|uniref:DUF5343 domain-containing protein n=1 Tax=uncultured Maricaulis sp. TaxID=174710 RepID=UPI0026340EF7|nr:DUF5343 domain-containing protein [uncultured Maricaulis sp.]
MTSLPYTTSPGNITKSLVAIKAATVPDRVSGDFVKTILKVPGGSGDQINSFLKKLGFTNSDGSPSELYKKFRNPSSSGRAIADAIRHAYAPLYQRNEYMHELDDEGLLGLIVETTGQAHDSNPVKLILSSIKHLKDFANFETTEIQGGSADTAAQPLTRDNAASSSHSAQQGIGLNLGYTINLNLPATSDPAVFDAIFRSLKENLLRPEDG